MVMNLFSVFDPASSLLNTPINWLSASLGMIFVPMGYWMLPSRGRMLFQLILTNLNKEIKTLLPNSSLSLSVIFISVILMILMNNVVGLLPYVFTASSHLVFTLSLALPLWLAYFTYGWVTNTTYMLAHLVPQGTPAALMPFMVLIESISNLIWPGTLSVRLAANMIAGHLLIALMSGDISLLNPSSTIMVLVSQIALLVLQSAVACIQAYVFGVLSAVYASEV